jgi:predicted nuclease of predicted toxin-antitoxin system
MRFKVDENLHPDVADVLRQSGHDALTVYEQGLRGHADGEVAGVCQKEDRAILTLDLDFSDVREFPPQDYSGVVVFRLVSQGRASVTRAVGRILPMLTSEPLAGHLWIVDEHHVRIRGSGPASTP